MNISDYFSVRHPLPVYLCRWVLWVGLPLSLFNGAVVYLLVLMALRSQ
jgi:hypothetical protein